MFQWNADKIRFLRDASEYTPFNEVLAERAAKQFGANAHVLDAGCGLGYLSLALSSRCARVTAADTSNEALSILRENVERRGIQNIDICETDVFALPETALFDGMVFCFFGDAQEILRCVKSHCRGKAVVYKKSWATHRFTAKDLPLTRFTFRQTCDAFTALGVPFSAETFALDMGQPFRSLGDAACFFRLHAREDSGMLTEAEIAARLIKTDSAAFPYYLPANRSVGMLTVDAGDIPDTIIITSGGIEQ